MRIQSTPLRVERDRRFFMCYTHLEGVPDLGSAARLMRKSLGGASTRAVHYDKLLSYILGNT